jgi:hypothetical protein
VLIPALRTLPIYPIPKVFRATDRATFSPSDLGLSGIGFRRRGGEEGDNGGGASGGASGGTALVAGSG